MAELSGSASTASPSTPAEPLGWTCGRCEVRVSWMPDVEEPALPSSWAEQGDDVYCLSCRRERAGEAAEQDAPEDASLEVLRQARAKARVEFEVLRDPDRPDGKIAKACHASIPAVKKARASLGEDAQRPL